jgi:YesN/AraC family two-component response regulator
VPGHQETLAIATAWVYLFDAFPNSQYSLKNRLGTWMDLHSKKHLSLEDLRHQMNLSKSRAGKVFKELFGETFTHKVNSIRIEKSKILLRSSRLGLADIAQNVGFDNEYYFGRIFKKKLGISPGRYRKEGGTTLPKPPSEKS